MGRTAGGKDKQTRLWVAQAVQRAAAAAHNPLHTEHPFRSPAAPTHLDQGYGAGGLQEGEVSLRQGQSGGRHVDASIAGQAQRAGGAATALQRARNLRAGRWAAGAVGQGRVKLVWPQAV